MSYVALARSGGGSVSLVDRRCAFTVNRNHTYGHTHESRKLRKARTSTQTSEETMHPFARGWCDGKAATCDDFDSLFDPMATTPAGTVALQANGTQDSSDWPVPYAEGYLRKEFFRNPCHDRWHDISAHALRTYPSSKKHILRQVALQMVQDATSSVDETLDAPCADLIMFSCARTLLRQPL